MQCKEFFEFLLNQGLAYRYTPERFAELASGGQPYPSPTRTISEGSRVFIEELIQPLIMPVTLSETEITELERIVNVFEKFLNVQIELFKMARKGEIENLVFRQMCTEKEWQFGLSDSGYSKILPFLRLDCIRTKEGFKVVDINSTRPAGVGDYIVLSSAYSAYYVNGNPFPMKECFVKTVKQCIDEWQISKSAKLRQPVTILVRKSDGDWHNFRILNKCLAEAGITSELAETIPVDSPRAIIRSRIKEGDPLFDELAARYPDKACVISPLYQRFLGNKLWMYLVHLPSIQSIFEEKIGKDDFEFLKNVFPESGIMKGNRICFADGKEVMLTVKNRKNWVIKETSGSSAKGMLFGFISVGRWEQLMSSNHDGCLGQRFIQAMEELPVADERGEVKKEKLYTKYGIFVLGGRLAGVEVMARRHHIVHGARNTYFSCCFKKVKV